MRAAREPGAGIAYSGRTRAPATAATGPSPVPSSTPGRPLSAPSRTVHSDTARWTPIVSCGTSTSETTVPPSATTRSTSIDQPSGYLRVDARHEVRAALDPLGADRPLHHQVVGEQRAEALPVTGPHAGPELLHDPRRIHRFHTFHGRILAGATATAGPGSERLQALRRCPGQRAQVAPRQLRGADDHRAPVQRARDQVEGQVGCRGRDPVRRVSAAAARILLATPSWPSRRVFCSAPATSGLRAASAWRSGMTCEATGWRRRGRHLVQQRRSPSREPVSGARQALHGEGGDDVEHQVQLGAPAPVDGSCRRPRGARCPRWTSGRSRPRPVPRRPPPGWPPSRPRGSTAAPRGRPAARARRRLVGGGVEVVIRGKHRASRRNGCVPASPRPTLTLRRYGAVPT